MPATPPPFPHVALGVTRHGSLGPVPFYRDILGLDKVYEKVQDAERGRGETPSGAMVSAWPGLRAEERAAFLVLDKQDREGGAHPIGLTDFGIHQFRLLGRRHRRDLPARGEGRVRVSC